MASRTTSLLLAAARPAGHTQRQQQHRQWRAFASVAAPVSSVASSSAPSTVAGSRFPISQSRPSFLHHPASSAAASSSSNLSRHYHLRRRQLHSLPAWQVAPVPSALLPARAPSSTSPLFDRRKRSTALSSRTLSTSRAVSEQLEERRHGAASSNAPSSSASKASAVEENGSQGPASTQAAAAASDSTKKAPQSPKDISLSEVRRLFTLAKPEKKTLGIAFGLLTVSSAVSLSVPFTLGRIIDLFTSPDSSSLPVSLPAAAAILASVFAIGALANTGRSILMRISGQRIVQRLRSDAYTNTLKLDMSKFDLMGQNMTDKEGKPIPETAPGEAPARVTTYDASAQQAVKRDEANSLDRQPGKEVKQEEGQPGNSSKGPSLTSALSLSKTSETTPDVGVKGVGDIISRLGSDASIVGESLTRELSEGLRALVTVAVGVGMMFYISGKLTALMLFIVPPSAIGAVFYGRYLKKLSRRTQKQIGEMIAIAEERLSSVRTVQAFNAVEPTETRRFNKKANEILELAKKEAYASGLFFGGAGFSGNITMLALLSYGGKLVSQGEITVGDLSSLMLYTAYVGSSLVGLTSFFSTIMKGLGAAARVFELLDARPTSVYLSEGQRLPVTSGPRTISFRNVHFSYPSRPDSPILRGVDLSIERGRSIAIAGGSGSGKSTLVNLLVRYYDPVSGSIAYGADDIRNLTPESWRERVSIVPQDPALFSQTVAENIAYGKPDATMSEIREAARLANCDFIDELPLGYDTPVGAKAAQLSGGQRQRLAIARALVRKPAILILDEATSALDAASETLVNDAVKRITATNDLTTILIAHRLSTLKTADEIVFMEDGRVVERGTYEELAQEGTAFWRMVRSQLLGTATGMPAGKAAEHKNVDEEKEAMRP